MDESSSSTWHEAEELLRHFCCTVSSQLCLRNERKIAFWFWVAFKEHDKKKKKRTPFSFSSKVVLSTVFVPWHDHVTMLPCYHVGLMELLLDGESSPWRIPASSRLWLCLPQVWTTSHPMVRLLTKSSSKYCPNHVSNLKKIPQGRWMTSSIWKKMRRKSMLLFWHCIGSHGPNLTQFQVLSNQAPGEAVVVHLNICYNEHDCQLMTIQIRRSARFAQALVAIGVLHVFNDTRWWQMTTTRK